MFKFMRAQLEKDGRCMACLEGKTSSVLLHLYTPVDCWRSILWTDEAKVETFGHNVHHHVRPGRMMIWDLATAGPGHLGVMELTMDSSEYLRTRMKYDVQHLNLGHATEQQS